MTTIKVVPKKEERCGQVGDEAVYYDFGLLVLFNQLGTPLARIRTDQAIEEADIDICGSHIRDYFGGQPVRIKEIIVEPVE